jgi:Rrf2 family protein
MNTSCRFAVAAHILAGLALFGKHGPATSELIADSVNTNPVVIRRILGALRGAGLVTSQPGPGGGWTLVRPPDEITLRDVYRAVEDDGLFALHHRPPNCNCPVGRNIQGALERYFQQAEAAMEHELAQVSVADVLRTVLAGVTACPRHG